MNNDLDIQLLVSDIGNLIENYSDKIDTDNLLAILISICHMIGDVKGYRRKDFIHKLNNIIKIKYVE